MPNPVRRRALAPLLFTLPACASAAEPAARWLQAPCDLLPVAAASRLLPAGTADALVRKPRTGRQESECLVLDPAGQRSLRLVLHPAKDSTRVERQLARLGSEHGWQPTTVGAQPAAIAPGKDSLSWGEANWMLTLTSYPAAVPADLLAVAAGISRRLGEH